LSDYDTLVAVKEIWVKTPKGVVSEDLLDTSEKAIRIAGDAGPYRVVLQVIIGKRGRLTEYVMAFDPSQRIEIDQFYAFSKNARGGYILPLDDMRKQIRAGSPAPEVCKKTLEKAYKALRKHPRRTKWMLKNAHDATSRSIHTVSGGLPTLGKRR
jgi:hypothetical protein